MSEEAWFNEQYYLQRKANALNAAGTGGRTDWTPQSVLASLEVAGLTPYQHYLEYGVGENLSPNPSFNPAYYLEQKAARLNAALEPGQTAWTAADVLQSMLNAGLTPMEHYQRYGAGEGLNPNQYFDQAYYLSAKAEELNAAGYQGRTDWTSADALQAILSAGMTPYAHFAQYGVDEGLNPSADFDIQAYLQEKADALNAQGGSWTPAEVLASMQAAGMDPVSHYIEYGSVEGLTITPVDGGEGGEPDPVISGGDPPTFVATVVSGVVVFSGTATGPVTMTMPDAVHAVFQRQGVATDELDLTGATGLDVPNDAISVSAEVAAHLVANHTLFDASDAVTVTGIVDKAAALTDFTTAKLGGSGTILTAADNLWSVAATDLDAALAAGLSFAASETVTVVGVAAGDETAALSAYLPAVLGGCAVVLDASDGVWSVAAADLDAALAAGLAFAAANVVTVTGIAAGDEDAALSAYLPANLGGCAVVLDAADNGWALDAATLPGGVKFGPDDVLSMDVSGVDAATAAALSIGSLGGSSIVLGGVAAISLTASQAASQDAGTKWAAGVAITVADAGTNLAGLTFASCITAVLGGASVVLDASDNAVSLTATQADALLASGLQFAASDVVTVAGVAAGDEAAALSAYLPAALGGGAVILDASDGVWSVAAADLDAALAAGVAFAAANLVTVTGIAAGDENAALSAYLPANLGGCAVVLDAADNSWALDAATLPGGVKFGPDDVLNIDVSGVDADTATALTTASLGGSSIVLTGVASVVLTPEQAASQAAGTKWAAVTAVTVNASGATLSGLTFANYVAAVLGGSSVVLDAADDVVSLTAAQTMALLASGLKFDASDAITLLDSGANLAGLTFTGCTTASLGGASVSLDASDDAVSLTTAQANNLAASGLCFAANDAVSVVDILAAEEATALTNYSTTSLGGASVTLNAADNAWNFLFSALPSGARFAADDVVNIDVPNVSQGAASALSTSGVGGSNILLWAAGAVSLTAAQAAAQDVGTKWVATHAITLADSGANLAGLTFANCTTATLGGTSVALDASDNAASLTVAQADALRASGLQFAGDDVLTVTGVTDESGCFTNYAKTVLGGSKVILDASDKLWNSSSSAINSARSDGFDFAQDNTVVIATDSSSITATSSLDNVSFTPDDGITSFNITDLGVNDYLSFNRFYWLSSYTYDNSSHTLTCGVESWGGSSYTITCHLDGVASVGPSGYNQILQVKTLD